MTAGEVMRAFKGFGTDMRCRGFQFVEGETYETAHAKVCEAGFHACESPLDVFGYYAPASSVYHVVELEDVSRESGGDSKVAARKITVGAAVSLAGLAAAHVEFVHERVKPDRKKSAHRVDDFSAASNTGNGSAASNTGDRSAASNTGDRSAASNTGDYSAASNTGNGSAASNTGNGSAASNTGDYSAASVEGQESVAIVTGRNSKARGATGCWLVLTERDPNWHILDVVTVKVGSRKHGTTIKPGVYYTLRDGKVVAA